MLRNYLTVALRNLWKRKIHTFINVAGLSLGVGSAIVIFLIVRYELSYENFHKHADRVYRVTSILQAENGNTYYNGGGSRPLPAALRNDFGDDLEVVVPVERYMGHQRVLADEQSFFVENAIVYTENGYFSLFDFPLLAGDRTTVLSQPNEVVISRSFSRKLFEQPEEALGQVINLNDQYDLTIVGVLADYPDNTGFDFGMLVSSASIPANPEADQAWDHYNSSFQTYVLLPSNVSAASVETRLPDFVNKYYEKKDDVRQLHLQPLPALHLEHQYGDFPYRKTSREVLGGMALLGMVLILLACINFINLATAVSTQRSKEIGVRKVVGSSRPQIIGYFLGETLFVTLVAIGLALGLAELGLIQLRQLYPFLEAVHLTLDAGLLTFLVAMIALVTGLAGFYPAIVLSRFRPAQMFKSTGLAPRQKRVSVRQALVVFQFFIAQVFILGVLVVGQQLHYLLEAPLGFDREAIITVNLPDHDPQTQQRFEETLQNHSGVESLSLSMFTAISQAMTASSYGYDGQSADESEVYTYYQSADDDYFDTYRMTFLAGGAYPPADSGSGFVVNESLVRQLEAESPEQVIGKYIEIFDRELPIVGVVADYHTNSFDSEIPPLLITNYRPDYSHLSLKIQMAQAEPVISLLQQLWQDNYPEFPFRYSFLDDTIAGFYEEHQRLLSLTQLFSGIAIAIGCLGLYGLVLFMAEQRTKEIGIRKVLGASVQQLLTLFSGEFMKLVLIAFCLAAPLAYFLMHQWLQDFAYRVDIGITVFIGCLLTTLLLVVLTVGYRATQAALANPVDSLRNE